MSYRAIARCLMLVVSVATIAGCRGVGEPDVAVSTGIWGGSEAVVTVTASGAHFEFPCASGDISQPFMTDSKGDFTIDGVYFKEAGPARVSQPARYSGHIEKDTMTLSVSIPSTGQAVGSFVAKFGVPGSFPKCV